MRRFIGAVSLLFSLIFLCSLCASCCSANSLNKPLAPTDLVKVADDATVALVYQSDARQDGTTFPFCTGVWVSQDVILTAGHCVVGIAHMETQDRLFSLLQALLSGENPGVIDLNPIEPMGITVPFIFQDEVTNLGQEPIDVHESKAFAIYRHFDLALLRVEGADKLHHHGIAKLAAERPERGEQLAFDGHVDSKYWTFRTGLVAAYRDDMSAVLDGESKGTEGPFMEVSAPVSMGDSGGGAFNDKGELVGIMSFISTGSPNTAFCIPIETIKGVLQAQKVIPMVLDLDPSAPDPKEYRLKK